MHFERTREPVLEPLPDLPWASGAVFNPGVWFDGETVHMLFRAVPAGYRRVANPDTSPDAAPYAFENYVSYIGYATSRDGLTFTPRSEPLLRPDTPEDRFGVEDPRLVRLDDTYFITYTALGAPAFAPPSESCVRIGLAMTPDFHKVRKHGVIGPPLTDKDAVLFPRRINGRIALLHRIAPDIQIAWFDSVEQLQNPGRRYWETYLNDLDEHVVLRPNVEWEARKVGAGPPPIETDEGWLLIYHGVSEDRTYRAGMALLDLDDPTRVIARTKEPILVPELGFELVGDVDNVVFPTGAVLIHDSLHLYYGAADCVIGYAVTPLEDALRRLRAEHVGIWPLPRVYMGGNGIGQQRSIERPPPVRVERLHGGRPVLEPVEGHVWEDRVVLNPAAVLVEPGPELDRLADAWRLTEGQRARLRAEGGACVMVYRAQGTETDARDHAPSRLGLAVLTPLLECVKRWDEPVLRPDAPYHDLGLEDARCTKIGDTYYLYYTGYTTTGDVLPGHLGRTQICLATTQDFLHWEQHGAVEGDLNTESNKNCALLPEPVGGKYILLHRPMYGRHPMAMHWAEADAPEGPWTSRGLLMGSYRYHEFALSWIGAGGPPLHLGEGRFLGLYHQGHFTWQRTREYDLAAMLLDFDHPAEPVRSRIEPLMRPTGTAERVGDPRLGVDNVLFSCANYRFGEWLVIPYAAADSRIFGARIRFDDLLGALEAAEDVGRERRALVEG